MFAVTDKPFDLYPSSIKTVSTDFELDASTVTVLYVTGTSLDELSKIPMYVFVRRNNIFKMKLIVRVMEIETVRRYDSSFERIKFSFTGTKEHSELCLVLHEALLLSTVSVPFEFTCDVSSKNIRGKKQELEAGKVMYMGCIPYLEHHYDGTLHMKIAATYISSSSKSVST